MEKRKFGRWGELSFAIGTVLLALGTVFQARAALGLSSTVAPAYVLSAAVGFIAPGTMCYICQGVLVLAVFALLRRFRLEFVVTFLSAVLFGLLVNLFTDICFVSLTQPTLFQRCAILILGTVINSLAIAFLFNSYFPPQAPELFAKEVSALLGWSKYKGKYVYDVCSCLLSVVLSLIFFRRVRLDLIGPATVFCALVNGPMIGFFGKIMEKYLNFSPVFPKVAALFEQKSE